MLALHRHSLPPIFLGRRGSERVGIATLRLLLGKGISIATATTFVCICHDLLFGCKLDCTCIWQCHNGTEVEVQMIDHLISYG